jgi:HupE / UreJ protein
MSDFGLCLARLVPAVFLLMPSAGLAHDIPTDVTVQVLFKPTGDQLHLVVRVPLKAMRDIEFPLRGPGYIDLTRVGSFLPDAATLWISDFLDVYEDGIRLNKPHVAASRVSLESDRSFTTYDTALAHLTSVPLRNDGDVHWDQAVLDALFDYPIESDRSRFSIHPGLSRLALRVVTVLRFLPPGGAPRAFEFEGDPGLVQLDPRWYQAAFRFIHLGFDHILDGTDHLLFLLCLVIPFRRFRALIPVITAFTAAHSITLIASAYDLAPDALWFPPLIETLIAISIVYMALENIVGGSIGRRRWMIAFGFGLVHGFGFSFALKQTLQFAGSHLLTSLLSFNVGVELGQLLVLILLIPLLEALFRFAVAERMGTIILSALVAHTGWHWMLDRADRLRQFPLRWPALGAAQLVSILHGLMVLVAIAAVVWLIFAVVRPRLFRQTPGKAADVG